MKPRITRSLSTAFLAVLVSFVVAGRTMLLAQCNLDQDNGAPPGSYVGLPICADGSSSGANFTSEQMAQTFTVGTSGILCEVAVYVDKIGGPIGNLRVQIQGVSGGVPDGVVHATRSLPAFAVVNGMNTFDLTSANMAMSAGEIYAIVLKTTEPFHDFDPPYYMVRYRDNPYVSGAGFVKWSNSSGWSGLGPGAQDVIFQTKVVPSPLAPSAPTLNAQFAAGALTFEWPTNFTGYSVQATSTPDVSNSWANVSITPSVVGSNYSVTFPTTNALQFFRLRSP